MDEDRLSSIYYFVAKDGDKPVKEFINSLTLREQTKVYAYIRELKRQGNNLRRPMADYLRDEIYELRPKITEYSISSTCEITRYWSMQ